MTDALRTPSESRMTTEGQQNAGGQRRTDGNGKPYFDQAPLSEYPRMLYRKTEQVQTQDYADAVSTMKDPPMVINRFDNLLCDTIVAESATEAEALAADGWDVSPKAAHGIEDGLIAATSAKDDEIARLRAELDERNSELARRGEDQAPRRGRPPRVRDDEPVA